MIPMVEDGRRIFVKAELKVPKSSSRDMRDLVVGIGEDTYGHVAIVSAQWDWLKSR